MIDQVDMLKIDMMRRFVDEVKHEASVPHDHTRLDYMNGGAPKESESKPTTSSSEVSSEKPTFKGNKVTTDKILEVNNWRVEQGLRPLPTHEFVIELDKNYGEALPDEVMNAVYEAASGMSDVGVDVWQDSKDKLVGTIFGITNDKEANDVNDAILGNITSTDIGVYNMNTKPISLGLLRNAERAEGGNDRSKWVFASKPPKMPKNKFDREYDDMMH